MVRWSRWYQRWKNVGFGLGTDIGKFLIPFLSIFIGFIMFPLIQPILYEQLIFLFVHAFKELFMGVQTTPTWQTLVAFVAVILFLQMSIAIVLLITVFIVGGSSILVIVIAFYLINKLDAQIKRSRAQATINSILKIFGLGIGAIIVIRIFPSIFANNLVLGAMTLAYILFQYVVSIINRGWYWFTIDDPLIQTTFSLVINYSYQTLIQVLTVVVLLLSSMYVLPIFSDLFFASHRAYTKTKLVEEPVEYQWVERKVGK